MAHRSREKVARQQRHSVPLPAAGLIDDALRRIDRNGQMKAYRVWGFWAEEVGAAIARRAQPDRFARGVLTVRVSNPAWMQELRYMKQDLIDRLNARLQADVIRDIAFEAGGTIAEAPKKRATPAAAPAQSGAPAAREPVEIPPLTDPRLAEVFARIARAHAQRRRD